MRMLFAAIAVAVASGCSTQTTLTIYTSPPGGYVSESGSGRVVGISPVYFGYDHAIFDKNRNADGCFVVLGPTVTWASGATQTVPQVELCGSKFSDYSVTVARPAGAPGLDVDLQFAVQVQQLQAQQQEADAAQNAYLLQLYNSSASQKVNCTSRKGLGDTVYTTCK